MKTPQRDQFIGPLSIISTIAMLGVKLLSAIIFTVVVLIAGLRNQDQLALTNSNPQPDENQVISSEPLPEVSLGLYEMPVIVMEPTTAITSIEFTETEQPTNTTAPTNTSMPTNTVTSTITNTATVAATSAPSATITSVSPTRTTTVSLAPTRTSTVSIAPTRTSTVKPTVVKTATSFPNFTPSAGGITFKVGSPLQGIDTSELSSIISQKFEAPAPGEDSGHHGVDLAFWQRGDRESIEGLAILSVFSGKVASAYNKVRNPYGYMVIVETPLSDLPENFMDMIELPTETVPSNPSNRLTCPSGFADWWSTDEQSLYVLYGHMQDVPSVKLGDIVYQSDLLGYVGNTGASSAPHLHLEMRIGPSDASFTSMGHYDTTTTDLERHNYCMWRVSGEFVLFDPMELYK